MTPTRRCYLNSAPSKPLDKLIKYLLLDDFTWSPQIPSPNMFCKAFSSFDIHFGIDWVGLLSQYIYIVQDRETITTRIAGRCRWFICHSLWGGLRICKSTRVIDLNVQNLLCHGKEPVIPCSCEWVWQRVSVRKGAAIRLAEAACLTVGSMQ